MKENRFYTYIYLDPRKKGGFTYGKYVFKYEPFYVGKGSYDQYKYHLREAINRNKSSSNKHKFYKIKKILKENLEPIILKVEEGLKEQESFDLEIWLIWAIGRNDLKLGPLVNLTNGGEGDSHTNETKEKISKSLKGWDGYWKGKKRSKEDKYKIGSANRGKPLSEETKLKIKKSTLGEKNHNYGKKGQPAWNKGIPCSEETRLKISNSLKGSIPWNKGIKE